MASEPCLWTGQEVQAILPRLDTRCKARYNGGMLQQGEMAPGSIGTVAQAVEGFRRDLGIRRSIHTVEAYTTALRHLEEYCAEAHAPADQMLIDRVDADLALSFVRWLQATHPVGPTTLDNYLSAISRFYRWLMLEDMARFSAADYARLQERLADVRGRRPPRPLPRVPAEDAVQALLQAAYGVPLPPDPNTPRGRRAVLCRLRNIALLEVLRSSGARVGETVALRRGDLDFERQAAVVTGKGRKQRLVYLDDKAWGAVTHYLKARQDGSAGRPLGALPVFARHDRGAGSKVLPISTNTVRAAIQELCQAAGLDEAITPHLLRHRFATGVLSATHDLAATQDLLGHSSPTTTRIYARLTDEDTAEAHRQARERGRI
jgi:site-specific recombinase XerD